MRRRKKIVIAGACVVVAAAAVTGTLLATAGSDGPDRGRLARYAHSVAVPSTPKPRVLHAFTTTGPVTDGQLITTSGGAVEAHRVSDGARTWSYRRAVDPVRAVRGAGRDVDVLWSDRTVTELRPDGELDWLARSSIAAKDLSASGAYVLLFDDHSYGGVDAPGAETRWRLNLPAGCAPGLRFNTALAGATAVVSTLCEGDDRRDELIGIDLANGGVLWRRHSIESSIVTADAADVAIATDADSTQIIDPRTGQVRYSIAAPRDDVPLATCGSLLVFGIVVTDSDNHRPAYLAGYSLQRRALVWTSTTGGEVSRYGFGCDSNGTFAVTRTRLSDHVPVFSLTRYDARTGRVLSTQPVTAEPSAPAQHDSQLSLVEAGPEVLELSYNPGAVLVLTAGRPG